MTDDQMQNVREDIAYMRAMAHEGRHAPLLAGPVLVAASLIFGAANLAQWAIDAGVVQVSDWAMLGVWIGAGVIFSACLVWLIGRMKRRPGFNSSGNRAVGAAWSAVGWGNFATWLGLLAMALLTVVVWILRRKRREEAGLMPLVFEDLLPTDIPPLGLPRD